MKNRRVVGKNQYPRESKSGQLGRKYVWVNPDVIFCRTFAYFYIELVSILGVFALATAVSYTLAWSG